MLPSKKLVQFQQKGMFRGCHSLLVIQYWNLELSGIVISQQN